MCRARPHVQSNLSHVADVEVVSCKVVGNRILEAIEAKALTHEETSRRVRVVTMRHLVRIIKGENCPSLERAIALSEVLGVPVDKLFKVELKTRHVE